MFVLFPFACESQAFGPPARRYTNLPPGWDANVKFEKLDGVGFARSAPLFGARATRPVLYSPGGGVMDRLAAWFESTQPTS